MDVALASGGLALTAAGIITLVDSASVAPAHTSGPDYNPIGGGTAAAIGTGLLVGGVALGAIASVDLVRARHVTRGRESIRADKPTGAGKVACRQGSIEGANVELRIGRVAYGAGTTDSAGHLATTLDAVLDDRVPLPLRGPPAKLVIAGRVEGEIDLRRLAMAREEDAWRRVNLQQCVEAVALDSCASVERYVHDYPDGPRAEDARGAIARAAPPLAKLREQLGWHRVQGSLPTCGGKDSEPSAIDVACGVLVSYVLEFPRGEHIREAEAAIAAGRARSKALRAKAERQSCVSGCRMSCQMVVAPFDECLKTCVDRRCER